MNPETIAIPREVVEKIIAVAMSAYSDPGRWTPRSNDYNEALGSWQNRAKEIALAPFLNPNPEGGEERCANQNLGPSSAQSLATSANDSTPTSASEGASGVQPAAAPQTSPTPQEEIIGQMMFCVGEWVVKKDGVKLHQQLATLLAQHRSARVKELEDALWQAKLPPCTCSATNSNDPHHAYCERYKALNPPTQ